MFLTRSESLERIRSRMFPCIWVGRLTNCDRLNLKTIYHKKDLKIRIVQLVITS